MMRSEQTAPCPAESLILPDRPFPAGRKKLATFRIKAAFPSPFTFARHSDQDAGGQCSSISEPEAE